MTSWEKCAVLVTLALMGLVSTSLCTMRLQGCHDECPVGQRCVLRSVQCVRAPCHPQPRCIVDRYYKPGSCPRRAIGHVGPCVVRCFGDGSCPGNQKCCGGCPTECVTPDFRNGEKPGSCPIESGRPGICVARCISDSSCPGDQKCCGSCPRECKAPARQKPGHCPPRLLRDGAFRGAWCRLTPTEECSTDYTCTGNRKCCDNGCHSVCTRPLYSEFEA